MATPLLLLQNIHVTFGSTALLNGAELSVSAGEKLCIVGRNGSGKSTLLKVAAGLLEADRGTRFAQPGATIRYLPQEPDLSGFPNTRSYVEAGLARAMIPAARLPCWASLAFRETRKPATFSGGDATGRAGASTGAFARHPASG